MDHRQTLRGGGAKGAVQDVKGRGNIVHRWFFCAGGAVLFFHLMKGIPALARFWITWVSGPLTRVLAVVTSPLPVSVAELLLCGAALWGVWRLVQGARLPPGSLRARALSRMAWGGLAFALSLYGGYCLLFGVGYYGASFQEKSGLTVGEEPAEALYRVTALFVEGLGETAARVPRDEAGVFSETVPVIFADSVDVYRGLEELYPFLAQRDLRPKALLSSVFMRYTDYTGVYFPFTGEAGVNVQAPLCQIPATVLHEFAHRRGIASEAEANFVAILAGIQGDSPVFAYSAYLLGYIHLSNSLYVESPALYRAVCADLPSGALADLEAIRAYHDRKSRLGAQVANVVYDGVLRSYGDASGIKSYGEVVDLLLAYF